MTKIFDAADEIADRLTPHHHEIPNTPEKLEVFRAKIATAIRDARNLSSFDFIATIADQELKKIHGAKSIDWVLGYQACAKAILNRLKY